MRNEDVFEAVAAALQRGEQAALVTIIRAQGSTPQRVGAKMLVYPDGRIVGTIGGACYENEASLKARTAIQARQPMTAKYELSDDLAEDSGLICGGQMEVYIEPLEPAPALYLVGGGHVAYHLAEVAHTVGFKLHVIDDREKFANAERFIENIRTLVEQEISIKVSVMPHPERIDEARTLVERMDELQGPYMSYSVGIIREAYGTVPDRRYTEEDLAWLRENHEREETKNLVVW